MKNFESDDDSENELEVEEKKQKTSYTNITRKFDNTEKVEFLEEEEDDFKRQLRLEKEEEKRKLNEKKKTKIDPDGTEYEYDETVKGWFPKIPDDRFLQYQMNYQGSLLNQVSSLSNTSLEENKFYLYNGHFYTWDSKNNKWNEATNPVYSYIDYSTGISFQWNQINNQWEQKPASSKSDVSGSHKAQADKLNINDKKTKKDEGWFDVNEDRNTNVYVSGLPLDATDEEFEQMMSKYGIIAKDLETGKLKARLYRDENNELKGDGRCCYLMPESVKLCLQLLDGSEFKNHKICVEKAKFELKGNYDPNKVTKKRNKNKEKKILEKQRQRLLDWEDRPEIVRQKYEKVVVIKGLFEPKDLVINHSLVQKLKDELKVELEEYGVVRKIILYEKNPEGAVTVSFKDVEDADECCEYLNNRVWKNGRIISCETWDGKSKFDKEESEEEQKNRIDEWHKFLEED